MISQNPFDNQKNEKLALIHSFTKYPNIVLYYGTTPYLIVILTGLVKTEKASMY